MSGGGVNRYEATRYLVPLREGGSLPAVVEAHDAGLWVVKFRGAGQGSRALIAEIIVAGLARRLDLPVPEVALIDMSEDFGRSERDPEIQDILQGSRGLNVGMRYLEGALNFDPVAAADLVTTELASRLVWLDALTTNPDRSPRNPNILVHDETLWLIDHGAALYAHHDWSRVDDARTRTPFQPIRDHVLLERATAMEEEDAELAARLDADTLAGILDGVPDAFLTDPLARDGFAEPAEARARYLTYLQTRMAAPRAWVEEAATARARRLAEPRRRIESRR